MSIELFILINWRSDDSQQIVQFGHQESAAAARFLLLRQEETTRTHPQNALPYQT